jgi:hypothetical protein|tara:strand:+ start:327 stop:560 length:234 start_codon:yes stop_codon:yes gene_type:complete
MTGLVFPEGLRVFKPRQKAPEFVKGALLINRQELIDWLQQQHEEEIRIDILQAKAPKTGWYCKVDDWKPDNAPQADF